MNTAACIEWTGYLTTGGYGKCRLNKKWMGAHRKAWILENGPIPPGLFVCHTCDNPRCINTKHLYLGTAKENATDRDTRGRNGGDTKRARTTHCKNGHKYTPENTYYSANKGGTRKTKWCRICTREKQRRYQLRIAQ